MHWYSPFLYDLKRYGLAFFWAALAPAAFLYFVPAFVKGDDALWLIFGVFGLGIVIAAIIFWRLSRHPERDGEKEMEQQLRQRMEAGEVLGEEHTEPLSEADRRLITRLKWGSAVGITIGLGIALYVFGAMAFATVDRLYAQAITIVLLILFAYLIYGYTKILDRILEKGEKSIIQGTITRRYARHIGRTTDRYFSVGQIEVKVFRHHYMSFHVGERIHIEVLRSYGDWSLIAQKLK